MTAMHRGALVLAASATGTAICLSVLAGWQRGGWLAEKLVWVAIGVVLVTSAHLLPALCRSAPPVVRGMGSVLWVACMVATSYGHATFFLLSQQHAGEARIASIAIAPVPHRSLTIVMQERGDVVSALARADARHCSRDCGTLRARRVSLAARRDALDAEAAEVRRQEAINDRDAQRRDAIRDDPVTARLAVLLAVPSARLDLFAGLAFAAVLEGVACLLWFIALQSRQPVTIRTAVMESVTPPPVGNAIVPADHAVTPAETEMTQLTRDIAAGLVRPTVSDIRRHLGCAQAKAAALRRQLVTPPS